jgi:hypothetical protein
MSDAICKACEMVVFWMQSELNPNKTKEGTLEYVDRVRVDLESLVHFALVHQTCLTRR